MAGGKRGSKDVTMAEVVRAVEECQESLENIRVALSMLDAGMVIPVVTAPTAPIRRPGECEPPREAPSWNLKRPGACEPPREVAAPRPRGKRAKR